MKAGDILKLNGMHYTPGREKLLNIMYKYGPLSHGEIKKLAGYTINRITLFRNLKMFLDKGIAVRFQDDTGVPKFFLNEKKGADHVHFKCTSCDTLYSLSSKGIRYTSLPKGYIIKERKLFITGICMNCNSSG